ncbi:hypothetical protein LT342_14570 [Delftia acidovorans]|nr:hypothetical protein [Delftia acidovorans]MCG3783358.1 hypothetical protein [Delftia acidovorans]
MRKPEATRSITKKTARDAGIFGVQFGVGFGVGFREFSLFSEEAYVLPLNDARFYWWISILRDAGI